MNKNYRLWAPIVRQEEEPIATLTYGDITFEIPATLMHFIAGWISIGCKGCRSINSGADLAIPAFNFLEKVMLYDANPPDKAAAEFYGEERCKRPELPDNFQSAESVYDTDSEYYKEKL